MALKYELAPDTIFPTSQSIREMLVWMLAWNKTLSITALLKENNKNWALYELHLTSLFHNRVNNEVSTQHRQVFHNVRPGCFFTRYAVHLSDLIKWILN